MQKYVNANFVINKYSDIVNSLYSNNNIVAINTVVKLQDGGIQKINTKLNIINMENYNGS